ncbi:uncharacterized protein LOC131233193 [Magnolia sinica]|uniref:uncharacterized protein LOC131233193 n=1 Tax=Magnolia sinica TaxID=86752 RepID=UPI0026596313|nr:uncharacterized protein LOC131233193 [Magnolia sinica]
MVEVLPSEARAASSCEVQLSSPQLASSVWVQGGEGQASLKSAIAATKGLMPWIAQHVPDVEFTQVMDMPPEAVAGHMAALFNRFAPSLVRTRCDISQLKTECKEVEATFLQKSAESEYFHSENAALVA